MKTPCDDCKRNFYGECKKEHGWRTCERYTMWFRMQWRKTTRELRRLTSGKD